MRNRDGGRSLWLAGAVAACCVLVAGQPSLAALSAPPLDPALRACVERLREAGLEEQRLCLRRLKEAGPAAAAATPALSDLLARSDGATHHLLLASILDVLRSLGHRAAPAAETLSSLLPHRSTLYKGRDKLLVVRLRAYIVVTLSEIGFPSSALPALLDTLAHVDERMTAMEVGAAARAVGSLGPRGCEFAPYLLDALAQRLSEEEFSLERYEPRFPPHEATTIQLEAVRSLGRVCSAADQQVLAALRQLVEDQSQSELDPRVAQEAQRALKLILQRHGERQ
jgi:DnaJ-domain-containing protein 1